MGKAKAGTGTFKGRDAKTGQIVPPQEARKRPPVTLAQRIRPKQGGRGR